MASGASQLVFARHPRPLDGGPGDILGSHPLGRKWLLHLSLAGPVGTPSTSLRPTHWYLRVLKGRRFPQNLSVQYGETSWPILAV